MASASGRALGEEAVFGSELQGLPHIEVESLDRQDGLRRGRIEAGHAFFLEPEGGLAEPLDARGHGEDRFDRQDVHGAVGGGERSHGDRAQVVHVRVAGEGVEAVAGDGPEGQSQAAVVDPGFRGSRVAVLCLAVAVTGLERQVLTQFVVELVRGQGLPQPIHAGLEAELASRDEGDLLGFREGDAGGEGAPAGVLGFGVDVRGLAAEDELPPMSRVPLFLESDEGDGLVAGFRGFPLVLGVDAAGLAEGRAGAEDGGGVVARGALGESFVEVDAGFAEVEDGAGLRSGADRAVGELGVEAEVLEHLVAEARGGLIIVGPVERLLVLEASRDLFAELHPGARHEVARALL